MAKKALLAIAVVLAISLSYIYFGNTANKTEIKENGIAYQKISAEEAMAIIEGTRDFILLDVRTEAEYSENRINGAVSLPLAEIEDKATTIIADRETIILVYCYGGVRSKEACQKLIRLGYTTVYDMGGISAWPYPDMIE